MTTFSVKEEKTSFIINYDILPISFVEDFAVQFSFQCRYSQNSTIRQIAWCSFCDNSSFVCAGFRIPSKTYFVNAKDKIP